MTMEDIATSDFDCPGIHVPVRKIAVVSMHSAEYNELSAITWDLNKKLYCEKHGYIGINYLAPDEEVYGGRFGYIKFKVVQMAFDAGAEWVWFTGCDALITDFTNDLRLLVDVPQSFIVAVDTNGINADSFFIKNDAIGKDLLSQLISHSDNIAGEQCAINELVRNNRDACDVVHQRKMNSYNYHLYPNPGNNRDTLGQVGQWEHGDLLIHFPGFTTRLDLRIGWAKEFLERVKYD